MHDSSGGGASSALLESDLLVTQRLEQFVQRGLGVLRGQRQQVQFVAGLEQFFHRAIIGLRLRFFRAARRSSGVPAHPRQSQR